MNTYKNSIDLATKLIQNGEIIIIPTDTLYGFSFDACNSNTIKKFNQLKKRKTPLSIIVDSLKMANKYAIIKDINLVESIFPGPYTGLFEKNEKCLSELVTQNSNKIGIRIPDNQFCQKLVSKLKKPITTTSVNIHGKLPLNNVIEIKSNFPNFPIFDFGELNSDGSTIIDFTVNPPEIVRQGDGIFKI